MQHALFSRRFEELSKSFAELQFHPNGGGMSGSNVKAGDWMRWATSAQSLVRAVYGEDTPHYQNLVKAIADCSGYDYDVMALRGIFLSAKDDFDGGYVFNPDLRVSGEVFGDFVALARQSLSEGNKDVAAVLACAALEDALKRYAAANSLPVEGKTMSEVVNLLKAQGLVAGAQKSMLDTMPKIRNYALHADWSKLSEPEVASVIAFVEQFLLSKFSAA
ncbi:DUF4145 domain-containing protein [Paucibacter sediminis]|uniref:DUF4145 domain-containing protein n=1 Tax=Paucibacter sediminis TaxID=3019553 RepID=A0AA95SXC9_9BURK|nr:DUF4145 domain-containing protein [Paucibacter sp. S2-9]WIT12754.1 DUF4145 domain-containing protein [Paucibacter sp. S2-9]